MMYAGGGSAAANNLMTMMGFGQKPARRTDLSKSKDSEVNKDINQ